MNGRVCVGHTSRCSDTALVVVRVGTNEARLCPECIAVWRAMGANVTEAPEPFVPEWRRRLTARDTTGEVLHP
jgi:hypothetical protein